MVGYHGWTHLRTVLRVRWETLAHNGTVLAEMERYFVSNAAVGDYTPWQWLDIVRAHWQVENGVHKTLDVSFREDDRPWSRNPAAMLALMILRRIACNAMAIFRAHSLREERPGLIPWRELMDWLRHAVSAATVDPRGLHRVASGRVTPKLEPLVKTSRAHARGIDPAIAA
jgi:hypothetical protein